MTVSSKAYVSVRPLYPLLSCHSLKPHAQVNSVDISWVCLTRSFLQVGTGRGSAGCSQLGHRSLRDRNGKMIVEH